MVNNTESPLGSETHAHREVDISFQLLLDLKDDPRVNINSINDEEMLRGMYGVRAANVILEGEILRFVEGDNGRVYCFKPLPGDLVDRDKFISTLKSMVLKTADLKDSSEDDEGLPDIDVEVSVGEIRKNLSKKGLPRFADEMA